jgi:hypothetical protein
MGAPMVDPQTCPRRTGEFGPWAHEAGERGWAPGTQPDRWEPGTHRWPDEVVGREEAVETRDAEGRLTRVDGSFWPRGFDRPRSCSFCGGVNPDDAIALVIAGWEVAGTGKDYKRYVHPPGYRAACDRLSEAGFPGPGERPDLVRIHSPVPPVKIYTMHFSEEQMRRLIVALSAHARGPPVP